MSVPTVSVVVPTFDRKDYLLACLESLVTQRHKPDEVIIVDDGSTDGTVEALANRNDLRLVQQRNLGPGVARNRGAELVTSDYIAFLDSDDLWYPWTLEVTKELLEEYRPSLLYARFDDFSETPQAQQTQLQAEFHTNYLESAGLGIHAGAGMMFVARSAFEKVGGFCEDRLNAEDHDFALRMGVEPGFVRILSPVTLAYRVHAGNETKNQSANLTGLHRIVMQERRGMYPGGKRYRSKRRKIISDHTRPAMVRLANSPYHREVFRTWSRTITWDPTYKRLPYLVYTSIALIKALVRKWTKLC